MTTDSKSTYQSLIDDVREEINEGERLAVKSDESFQVDILNAEQKIADDYDIAEEYELRLTTDVDEYFFQDRPAVIDALNASPISIRSKSVHGLADQDIIITRFVQGNDAANGSFRIGLTDTLNFTLKEFARITGTTVDGTTVTATTEKAHGWSTGASVLIDGSEGYMDGTFAITVTGVKTFTFTHTVVGDYNGLGIASKDSTGNGAYVAGGRFWKENEIPTHIGRFDFGEMNIGNIRNRVDFVEGGEITDEESWESFWTSAMPAQVAQGRKNGKRYLRFSIPPSESQTIRLFGILKITPSLYYDDPITATIHLDSEWDEAIKHFVMSKAYRFLKDGQNAQLEMNAFLDTMRTKKLNTVAPRRIRMVYD